VDVVSILRDLAVKYKILLLGNPEVFILVFALGWAIAWFIVRARVGNAQAEIKSTQAEIRLLERHIALQAEHYKGRIEALEMQRLKTYTPPHFEKLDQG